MNPLRRKHPGWSVGSLFAAAEEDSSDSFCSYEDDPRLQLQRSMQANGSRTFQVLTNWVGGLRFSSQVFYKFCSIDGVKLVLPN